MTFVTAGAEGEPGGLSAAEEQTPPEVAERPRAGRLKLTGKDGLSRVAKMMPDAGPQGEPDEYLSQEARHPAGQNSGRSRQEHRAKAVLTEAGPVALRTLRHRDTNQRGRATRAGALTSRTWNCA